MKALSSVTNFLCSSSRNFFTRSTPLLFKPENVTPVGISKFSTLSPDASNVRVSVWWNLERCSVSPNADIFEVTQHITGAVRAHGIEGPIQIRAFGDDLRLSRSNKEAINSKGIEFHHISQGCYRTPLVVVFLGALICLLAIIRLLSIFCLISDDLLVFESHLLRMKNHNILLATTDNAPRDLCSAASIMWEWSALVKGENLSGKLFNQPPDGPLDSWYGHYSQPPS